MHLNLDHDYRGFLLPASRCLIVKDPNIKIRVFYLDSSQVNIYLWI